MKIINLNEEIDFNIEKNYIALGNFDGLHRGHMKIIRDMVEKSKENKVKSSVLLFESHTLDSIFSSKQKQITSLDQKIKILEENQIDLVFLINFSAIKDLEPEEFITILREKLNVCGVFVGFDYSFGKNAKGNVDLLKSYSSEDFLINVKEAEKYEGQVISSTRIKGLIASNHFAQAEALLDRPYILEGRVIAGKKIGTSLGFPTANIDLKVNYVLPSEGVYVSQVFLDGKTYLAATSLGINYTFDEIEPKVEAHIINFNENIYGKDIKIRFIRKLRPMVKFPSIEEMTDQVLKDIELVKSKSFDLE